MTHRKPARTTTRRIRIRRIRVAGLLVVIAAIAAALGVGWPASSSSTAASPSDAPRNEQRGAPADAPSSTVWPAYGQAAFIRTGQSQIQAGPNQHAAPIASVAKVMTAYLVLRDHPLRLGRGRPDDHAQPTPMSPTPTAGAGQGESVVPIAAGEQLTERQALQALLLPSANNIAAVLARWDAGSVGRFVARMNATARSLGMTHTRYTDPSGYDDATVSTAADQVRHCRSGHAPAGVREHRRHTERDTAGRRHRAQHQHTARAQRVCRRQDRLARRGRRLLRLPRHPLDRRQADDDHRSRVGPARPRPGRGRSRGRRRHGRSHRRPYTAPGSGIAGAPAAAPGARSCAAKVSTTAAGPAWKGRRPGDGEAPRFMFAYADASQPTSRAGPRRLRAGLRRDWARR